MSTVLLVVLLLTLSACARLNVRKAPPPTQDRTVSAPRILTVRPVLPTPARPKDPARNKEIPGLIPPYPSPDRPAPTVMLRPPDAIANQVPVGLLLPLSGPHAALGQSLLKAAQLALFEVADGNFGLMPQDTKGTPEGAREAATLAIEAGARILLGPVFAESAVAVAPLAREAGINVIAFTNNRRAAAEGSFVFGFQPYQRINRVVSYAVSKELIRFVALVPNGPFGDQVLADFEAAVVGAGGIFVRAERYEPGQKSAADAVKRLGNYAGRRWKLRTMRRELEARGDATAKRQLKRLKGRDTLGDVDFDAVFLPETGEALKAVAPLLPYYDIDIAKIRILGINDWSARSLRREPALAGAWFAAISPVAWQDFANRFKAIYGAVPHPLAPLAYDAMAMAAVKALPEGGGFGLDALTGTNGFAGTAGLFRLRPNGLVEHRFAVIEVQPEAVKVVAPSPQSFADFNY